MINIYFAIPTHSGTITVETAISALDFNKFALQHNIAVRIVFHSASIISHLRNTVIADFLAGDFTHLFMLDSDQGIEYSTIFKMIDSGFHVVGALYPRRNFFWDNFDPSRSDLGIDDLLRQGYRFVGEILPDKNGSIEVKSGFVRAKSIGTGSMLIRREVIELMMIRYPELKGQGFPEEDENIPRMSNNWGFFNPLVKSIDGINAGEDIGFCKRWIDCGGEIWADVVSNTVHVGRYKFTGNYLDYMRTMGATVDRK